MKKYEILNFPKYSDERGSLVPFEFSSLPFEPKRVYLVTATEGSVRGGHSHAIEEEIFLVTNGSATLVLNEGEEDTEVLLDSRTKGVLVRTDCWHELKNFSPDAVVLALSSTSYLPGESNYLTDKAEFLAKFKKAD